jgi:hypothetical protein
MRCVLLAGAAYVVSVGLVAGQLLFVHCGKTNIGLLFPYNGHSMVYGLGEIPRQSISTGSVSGPNNKARRDVENEAHEENETDS